MAQSKFLLSLERNNEYMYHDNIYFLQMWGLIQGMFKWENLPSNIKSNYIEEILFTKGKAFLFDDKTIGTLVCSYTSIGELNHYGEPVEVECYSLYNNYNSQAVASEGIIIRNNELEIPSYNYVLDYSKRLARIDRDIQVNLSLQKYPSMILCNEKQKEQIKKVIDDTQELGKPIIFGSKDLKNEFDIQSLALPVPYIVTQLEEEKEKIKQEFLSIFGINNANTMKRERLNSDEVNANNQYLELCNNVFLKCRQEVCKQINAKYNTNTTVNLSVDFKKYLSKFVEGDGGNDKQI